MITGKVTANLEATIEIEVSGDQPPSHRTEAVIDRGFNGYLTLPSHLIILLNLLYAGHRYAILGDGSDATLDAYFVTVSWHGQDHEEVALQGDWEPLVGMSLLRGSRFSMEVVAGGDVLIEQLPLAMCL